MAEPVDKAAIGAVGSVLTILLGSAGLNMRSLAKHNANLIAGMAGLTADKDALNLKLIEQAGELGRLKSVAEQVDRLKRELAASEEKEEKLEAEITALKVEAERLRLEKLGLLHRLESQK